MALTHQWQGYPVHWLPGRIRVRLPGLRGHPVRAGRLVTALAGSAGIRQVVAGTDTGSLLIIYDPAVLSPAELGRLLGTACGVVPARGEPGAPAREPNADGKAQAVPPAPAVRQAAGAVLLSGAALALVAARRMAAGPSPLSRSWLTYDLAGLLAVVAGYPRLRRGVAQWLQRGRLSADLVLGTAGLAALILRENLLGLAVLLLINLNHLFQAETLQACQSALVQLTASPDTAPGGPEQAARSGAGPDHAALLAAAAGRQAERWSRWALGTALLTGLLTGNWRRALAALIAAAPAAVALAGPLPLALATAAAARRGMPVRHPGAMAAAGRVDTVLFDQTGMQQADLAAVRCAGVQQIGLLTGGARQVAALQAGGHTVALVGAGDNAAPGLAAADLGLALAGGAGGSTALQAADVVVTRGGPRQAAEFICLGRRAAAAARQNRMLAAGLNAAGLALAAGGFIGPLAATIWQNLTVLGLIGNSARFWFSLHPARRRLQDTGLCYPRPGHTKGVNLHSPDRGEADVRPRWSRCAAPAGIAVGAAG